MDLLVKVCQVAGHGIGGYADAGGAPPPDLAWVPLRVLIDTAVGAGLPHLAPHLASVAALLTSGSAQVCGGLWRTGHWRDVAVALPPRRRDSTCIKYRNLRSNMGRRPGEWR